MKTKQYFYNQIKVIDSKIENLKSKMGASDLKEYYRIQGRLEVLNELKTEYILITIN